LAYQLHPSSKTSLELDDDDDNNNNKSTTLHSMLPNFRIAGSSIHRMKAHSVERLLKLQSVQCDNLMLQIMSDNVLL